MSLPYKLINLKEYSDIENDLIELCKQNELIVLVINASYCKPCTKLKQAIYDNNNNNGLSIKYTKCKFFYIDYEQYTEVCDSFKVQALPTLSIGRLINNKYISKIQYSGGDPMKLVTAIEQNI